MSVKEGNKEGSDLSQFAFLQQEWPAAYEAAGKAESLASICRPACGVLRVDCCGSWVECLDPGLRRGDMEGVRVSFLSVIPAHAGIQAIFLLFVTLYLQCCDVGSASRKVLR